MLLGVTLPTFSTDAAAVMRAAGAAEAAGLHGVFMFDHLWPIGSPSRPALSLYPTLGAVLAVTDRIAVGSLVARVGLLPDEVVLAGLGSLARMGHGRFIACVGTGDSASADENDRIGVPYQSAGIRRLRLAAVAETLIASGAEIWIGGGSPATNAIAPTVGATLNLWGADPAVLAELGKRSPVSWAGPLPKEGSSAVDVLRAVAAAGATWAIWGWPQSLDLVAEAASAAGIELAGAPR